MKKVSRKNIRRTLLVGLLMSAVVLGGSATACNNKESGNLESNYNLKPSVGRTYWLAPDAANGEGDGSESNPYSIRYLFANASTLLSGGDTIKLKAGTYELDSRILIQKNGDYDNYITMESADPKNKAVLDFHAMTFDGNNRGVQLDANYWHWNCIDICGAGDNGMYIGGSYNVVENSEFYENRDTGLQLGRKYSPEASLDSITEWPSYNLIKNCTSYNNYDNQTYGENADGFAAKLTIGYGNIFDGCIAYRNSDDGWDLFAKTDSGNIGAVIIYNCVAFENGYLAETQKSFNAKFPTYDHEFDEPETESFLTRDGDGNGFKLGGSVMEGDVFMYNCQTFNNRMHGVTDNSNPGVLSIKNVTAYNNSAGIDDDKNSDNFGRIILNGAGVSSDNKSGNINLARQTYSYNLMSGIVSVNDDLQTVAKDEYRGSAEYSYFDLVNGSAYKVDECVDASNRTEAYAKRGANATAIPASVFAKVPSSWGDVSNPTYAYELDGVANYNVHKTYRNEDGSINMGDMLKITDYSKIFGDSNKTGADLTKGSWNDYTHYSYYNASNASSEEDAVVKAATATLDLNTNLNATFQDFDLIVAMQGVRITWESSDIKTIAINTDTPTSPSGTHDARAIVYRGSKDKVVRLTATITHTRNSEVSMKKYFDITVKQNVPTVGEAIFEGVEDGRIIIDQFANVDEPEMTVRNAADYNGKLLNASDYTVKTNVTFATDKTKYPAPVDHFTTNVSGVYNITKEISLGEQTRSFTYSIYVASSTADVTFIGEPLINVNKNGYTIGGEVSSATGKLYAYSSQTKVDGITDDTVISQGKSCEFRDDKIQFQFDNDNSQGYYIYYLMTNLKGQVTTHVAEVEVSTKDINTVAEFKAMLKENDSSTIYMLKNDIDLSGETNWAGEVVSAKTPFKGVLNGLGHTVSGLTVNYSGNENEQAAMFYKLEGGTIENIKFENIHISSPKEKVGIIATTYGGYLYNIQMRNVYVKGAVRVGGLVGQAVTGDLYVDQISLINDAEYESVTVTAENIGKDIFYTKEGNDYVRATEELGKSYYVRKIDIDGARSAGIIGFIQAGSATEITRTYISNVYVDAVIGRATEQYVGSVVGSADDRNVKDYLEIKKAISMSTLYARTYCGGILGSHNKGTGTLFIEGALFYGDIYYAQQKTEISQLAVKNSSGIVGRYVPNANATVRNCFAKFADHNTDFDVDGDSLTSSEVYITIVTSRMGLGEPNWEVVVDPDDEYLVIAPFARLKFLGDWTSVGV